MQYYVSRLIWMTCLLGLSSSLNGQNYFTKIKEDFKLDRKSVV
jgi:hypothetical protein